MPSLTENEVKKLTVFYQKAEVEIINQINSALLNGNKTDYLEKVKANIQAILIKLQEGAKEWTETALPAVYTEAIELANAKLVAAGVTLVSGFGALHTFAMESLALAAFDRLEKIGSIVGRRYDDIYRTLALEVMRGTVSGYTSWQSAATTYRERLAQKGVTGFTDVAGREWRMGTYVNMVARTTTMEAHLAGTANRLIEHGFDLVKVSKHKNPCEKCEPFEGEILSLTGKTKGYKTLAEARKEGLFHPNCKHSYGAAITLVKE